MLWGIEIIIWNKKKTHFFFLILNVAKHLCQTRYDCQFNNKLSISDYLNFKT